MRYLGKAKRVPYLFWYARHEFTHVLIGLVFAWFLREVWQELSLWYTVLAVVGSVLIDSDHFLYIFAYGRNEGYAKEVKKLLRSGQFGNLFIFLRDNHKYNTGLATHNIYFIGFFILLSFVSFQFDWKTGTVIFGAIVLHLLYDVFDDLWVLGKLNENWKRLRRKKKVQFQPIT